MTELKPKPEGVEIPDDRKWEEMPPATRYYYRNKEEEKERINNRKIELRKWYQNYKSEEGCEECDVDDPRCLEFHHPNRDGKRISYLVGNGVSKENLLKEMKKCELLCCNCHAKQHRKIL